MTFLAKIRDEIKEIVQREKPKPEQSPSRSSSYGNVHVHVLYVNFNIISMALPKIFFCLKIMFMYLFSEILTDMKFLEIAQRYTDYRKLAFALGLTTADIRHAQKINETYKDPTDITMTILEVFHTNSHLQS